MDKQALWQALESHPTTGWRAPQDVALPVLPASARLLWCGIGGSLLPSETLVRALGTSDQLTRWTPLASPEPMALTLRPDDQVVFASKSGKTLELWTWIARLRAMSGWKQLDRPPIMITQDDQNPLAKYARAEGWSILPIPVDVGGRYSAFTPIGTLPLAWMGRDAAAFFQGGREVVEQMKAGRGLWADRVWEMTEQFYQSYLRGVDVWVLLPYHLRLETLTAWWVQLVAESLGKVAQDGTRRGIVPLRAVGPIDQHSQLQLWMQGPRRFGLVELTVEPQSQRETLDVPAACPYQALAALQGTTILQAQAEGTREALAGAGVPVVHWHIETPTEHNLGALMMAWQIIVGLTGFALEIDPFDQPGVEDGKLRTFKKLGLA